MLLADGPVAKSDPVRRRLGFVPAWLEVQLTAGRAVGEPLCPGFLAERAGDEPSERSLDQFDVRGQLAGRHRMHPSMYRWSKSLLPNYQLTAPGDRMERGHSLEARLPFHDHPLVERAVAMPPSLKVRDKIEKYALREAARPVLTPSVHKRQEHPFMAPPREEPGARRAAGVLDGGGRRQPEAHADVRRAGGQAPLQGASRHARSSWRSSIRRSCSSPARRS